MQAQNARFQIIRALDGGKGGFGQVFQGIDRYSGGSVAIKYLHQLTSDAKRRFEREVTILKNSLNNPHIVKIVDYNLHSNPPFIVMEYCDGGSLRSWVSSEIDNCRPWLDVAAALLHTASGLLTLHEQGGFHRDIKPENLLVKMVDGRLVIKLADFGLARLPNPQTHMTAAAHGTHGYIAPELLAGTPASPASDIYSLGITGIELLTGFRDVNRLDSSHAPVRLKSLLCTMIDPFTSKRPEVKAVTRELAEIIQVEQDLNESPNRNQAKTAAPSAQVAPNNSDSLAPLLLAGLFIGGLILVANSKK